MTNMTMMTTTENESAIESMKPTPESQSADFAEEFTLALSDINFVEEASAAGDFAMDASSTQNDVGLTDSDLATSLNQTLAQSTLEHSVGLEADKQFDMSLPAALCDEALIKEVQSIPDKMGFKIGEVADMLGIKQYVLRYWESEFDILKPKKAPNNQRYYTKKDVENAYLIRKLLHRDRFSIEGARSAMKDLKTFVRSEVKKEKDISTMNQKFDVLHDHVEDLILDIRELRQLFQ